MEKAKVKSNIKGALALALGLLVVCALCACAGRASAKECIQVEVDAPGWSDASSSVIVRVEGQGADFYHAMDANEAESIEVPAQGAYTVTVGTPVNADGSIYRFDDASVSVGTGAEAACLTGTAVAAQDVSREEIDAIIAWLKQAVIYGDETLTGSAGKQVASEVSQNIANNPNASSDDAQQAADVEVAAEGESASGASDSSASQGSAQTGGSSEPATTPAPSSAAHVHTSVTEWVSTGQTWVVDVAAHEECTGVICDCGLVWYTTAEYWSHCKSACCGYQSYYETVAEQGHYEETGYYRTYCSECGAEL